MTRVSKRVREEAALACAMSASTWRLTHGIVEAFRVIDDRNYRNRWPSGPAYRLARSAFDQAYLHRCTKTEPGGIGQDWHAQMAEAESMLRTGWSPE